MTQDQAKTSGPDDDLASQLERLMSKVSQEEPADNESADTPTHSHTEAETAEPDPLDIPEVDAALGAVEDAASAVQDAVAELEPPAGEADASDADGDALAEQLQALLDESAAQASETPEAEEPAAAGTDGAIATQAAEPDAADDDAAPPAMIDQIDDLLAEHADDALAGEFETVEALMDRLPATDSPDPPDTEASDAAASPGLDATGPEPEDDEDNELLGDFDPPDSVINAEAGADVEPAAADAPATDAPPEASAEPETEEDDELDGDFAGIDDLDGTPPPAAEADTQDPAVADGTDEDDDDLFGGDFESLDALLSAPTPAAPPPPAAEPAASQPEAADRAVAEALGEMTEADSPTDSDETADRDEPVPPAPRPVAAAPAEPTAKDHEAWSITLNLAMLRAAAVRVLSWTLIGCAMINKPLERLPEDVRQTVGWVALAVAGPGLLLIGYGLLFN